MISVFVYGTLLVGEANHHVVAPYLVHVEPGAVRGRLYDYGPYPALVLDEQDEWIYGEWFQVMEEGLAHMDQLEDYRGPGQDNHYERVWIQDSVWKEREGWVYIWEDSRGCSPIPGGSWRSYMKIKGA